ncbi:MAG: DNA adenine methylase [Fervidobacterium sp.]|uniref:DNA adenine methylase n=1 Tax=Fervidobacterium sp. TaxID=1871331 RepID=UPI0025C6F973|nr:DNA adenine methylase [Fervidobacterium sp.]NPU89996.1 DNA adenine methylase [Fervidobacterium sp.]
MELLVAPFPYFGGKRRIADKIWHYLGYNVPMYIEPFFGSGAVLLARKNYDRTKHREIVCNVNGYLCNVWRALQNNPDEVARVCDYPVNHIDLTARRNFIRKFARKPPAEAGG